MKASAILFWTTFSAALGCSLTYSGAGSPFKKLYVFQTAAGPIYIAEWKHRFYVIFREESFGSYSTPEAVAEDLAHNHLLSLPGINLKALGLPGDLKKWQRL